MRYSAPAAPDPKQPIDKNATHEADPKNEYAVNNRWWDDKLPTLVKSTTGSHVSPIRWHRISLRECTELLRNRSPRNGRTVAAEKHLRLKPREKPDRTLGLLPVADIGALSPPYLRAR